MVVFVREGVWLGSKEEIAVEVVFAEVSSEQAHAVVCCKNPSVHATETWDLKRHMAVALSLPAPAIQASGADSSGQAPAVVKHAQMTVLAYSLHVQGWEAVQAAVEVGVVVAAAAAEERFE